MRLWTAPIWLLGTIITTSFRFQLSRTQIPRASWSVGDHPLTKEPEDSKYDIAFPAPLSLVILRWWKRDPRKGNVIINVGLSYIIPENRLKFFPKFPPPKALKFFLEMSKILQKFRKILKNFGFFNSDITGNIELYDPFWWITSDKLLCIWLWWETAVLSALDTGVCRIWTDWHLSW